MQGIDIFNEPVWNPFEFLGLHHALLAINTHTIINTWLVLAFLCILIGCIRLYLFKKESMVSFLITYFTQIWIDLTTQTLGTFNYAHFSFVVSLFMFIALCNIISIFPWIGEPTKDLNTTIALGCISFFYKEIQAIKVHGFFAFIKEFLQPFFVMLPLNIMSHYSKIISLSFRLFGNIFGGSIILEIYRNALSYSWIFQLGGLLGLNIVVISFFVLFEGLMQSFVFSMLTLTYINIATEASQIGEID
jgi:F-type H+-transporting ATPase subunit a